MKTICVYCGSNSGKSPVHLESARTLGKAMLANNINLVYGGASIGVMGEIANTVLSGGGEVIGIIPQDIADKEVAHAGLTELYVVKSMHERKAKMAQLSDGFVALPGGIGTLEELFEVLTWAQLGFHAKPIAMLNVDGYYDHLIKFLENAVEQEFVGQIHKDMLLTETNPDVLLKRMSSYVAPVVNKWIDLEGL